jgi:predicted nucleic acid-binding protein
MLVSHCSRVMKNVTVTHKLQPGMSRKLTRQDVRSLMNWQPVPPDLGFLESSWALQDRYNLPWPDAPIVAAALQAGCRCVLSEDFQDGIVFDEGTAVNPFERGHESVLEKGGPETRPKES